MHEIVKQVAWVGHCSFFLLYFDSWLNFCVITFCFLFKKLDSWRLALQSLLSWWCHRDAQDADGWSCRVWRWNSCNRGPGNSHSLQPAPWNQVWALYWKDVLFSYANSRWAKMLSHSCHGPRNLRWKRESWYLIATSLQNYLLFWLPSVTCACNCIFISWFCIRWESNGFSCSHSLFCKLDITGAWNGLSSSLASWSLMWLTEAWCLISSTILSIIWNVWNNPYMIYALQLAWYPCLKCRFLGYHYPYLRGCCFRILPGTSKHIIECMYT